MSVSVLRSILDNKFINTRLFSSSLAPSRNFKDNPRLPERPKRPNNSWSRFILEKLADVIKKNGNISADKISRILSREWKYTDKTPYMESYRRDLEGYQRRMKEYEDSLCEEDKFLLTKLRINQLNKLALRALARKYEIPKKPRNYRALFFANNYEKIKEDLRIDSSIKVLIELGARFRNLSEPEKQEYKKLQELDEDRFKREFSRWSENSLNDPELGVECKKAVVSLTESYKDKGYL